MERMEISDNKLFNVHIKDTHTYVYLHTDREKLEI